MSISISSYRSNPYSQYLNRKQASETESSAGLETSNTIGKNSKKTDGSDPSAISYLAYLAAQSNIPYQTFTQDNNAYGSDYGMYNMDLSTEDKKTMLSDLQSKLSSMTSASAAGSDSASTDAEATDPFESLVASLQSVLSDADLTTASDDEISSLFDKVSEVMDKSAPPIPPGPPPTGEMEQEEESLTTDDMKSILSELQSRLSALGEDDTLPDSMTQALAEVQKELSGYDASTATDDQVAALFEQVSDTLDSARPEHKRDDSGLPPQLRAMGGVMPPFAWGLDSASSETDSAASDSYALTGEELNTVLSDLQQQLEALQSGGTLSGGVTRALFALKEQLSGLSGSSSDSEA